jgi:hypothetical protein
MTITPSPLDAIVHEAARKMLGLRMTKIAGAADRHDADNLRADLEAIWSIVDPIIEAVGQYASEHFEIDVSQFNGQLRSALEGNATYEIEKAADKLLDDRREFNADRKGWAKAALQATD